MSVRAAARQYAHALFDVAEKNGTIDRVGPQLSAFGDLIRSSHELGRVFGNPTVPLAKKNAILHSLIQASGGVSIELERLLLLLADRDRLTLVDDVAKAFSERSMDAARVGRAEITSAVALGPESTTALARALGAAVGREVTIDARVDPAIIGGLVAKVGSVVFDASVTRRIERLREKLLADV